MRLLLSALAISIVVILLLLPKVSQKHTVANQNYPPQTQLPSPTVKFVSDKDLFAVVNNWREKANLPQYKESNATCDLAYKRAPQLKRDYSHTGFHELLRTMPKGQLFSENIAFSHSGDPSTILSSWLSSKSHRATLYEDYSYSCIKCDSGYCVQIFSNF